MLDIGRVKKTQVHQECELGNMLTTYLYILLVLTKGFSSVTVTTKPELNVTLGSDTKIVLNCTYSTDSFLTITWKKSINGNYKNLANFYPGGRDPTFTTDGLYLRNRSSLINPGNGSTSAVLKINDVKCEDDGRYQCFITYAHEGVATEATSETTVFLQVSAEQPTSFMLYTNGTLKENDRVNLSCSANVGNPYGFVAIWKLNKFLNKPVLLNKSSSVNDKTENCTAIANLNITYTVSREDNGAIFRCSSQSRQTEGPAPHKNTTAIDVYYGPSNITMHSSSSDLDLYLGANVNLTCSSDGNPPPTFKWKFNNSYILNDERHSLTRDNKTLRLINLNFDDDGIYSCVATNSINGEIRKVSSNLTVKVQKRGVLPINKPTCEENPCGITESCSKRNGRAVCTTNIWSFISFLFILLTIVFMITTAILCIKRRRDQIRSLLSGGNIASLGVLHSQESDTGHAKYEVLNTAGTMNAPGTSDTENTRYEVLNTTEQTSALRERNTTNREYMYEALQEKTNSDADNHRYEVLNRTEQANVLGTRDNMNAGYEVLNKMGESNVYEKIGTDSARCENLNLQNKQTQ